MGLAQAEPQRGRGDRSSQGRDRSLHTNVFQGNIHGANCFSMRKICKARIIQIAKENLSKRLLKETHLQGS